MTSAPEADLQASFFASMSDRQPLRELFEYLPGIHFFIKDAQSRMITSSRPILDRLGLKEESEIVGKTDYDFFPQEVADNFVKDDRKVLESGRPIVDRVEVWYNDQRVLDWFVTTKLPIRGKDGSVIGIMGMTQSYEGKRRAMMPFTSVSKAIEYIRKNHHRRVSLEELAKEAGLSVRQLNRKFRETFHLTPHEFAIRTRIQGASEALARTNESIADIAVDHGFCDQSAFTLQFRKYTGMTPRRFRERHRRLGSGGDSTKLLTEPLNAITNTTSDESER